MIPDEKLKLISVEFSRRKKDTLTAYILCVFFWFAGVHKFYLTRITEGIIYLMLSLSLVISLIAGLLFYNPFDMLKISLISFALIFIFLLYDIITLWKQVEKANEKIYGEIFMKITGIPYH